MQIADPPTFSLPRRNVPKESKSWSQHLNSLKKLLLAVHFLEANDVVMVQEFFEIIEFGFPVSLSGENRSNKAPGDPSNTSQTFGKEMAASIPPCSTLEYLRLCVKSTLSPARTFRSRKSNRSPSLGASGESEGLEGHGSYWKASDSTEQGSYRTCEFNILRRRSFLHHWSLTATKPWGSEKKARWWIAWATTITKKNLLWSRMLMHAKQHRGPNGTQSEEPIERENRRKMRLDPPGGERTGRRGSGHHT